MWNLLLETTKDNMTVIIAMVCLFALSWLANFCLSVYNNIKQIGESFDKSKLLNGIEKLICIIVGLFLLTVVLSAIPIILDYAGLNISEGLIEGLEMVAIITPLGTAIIKYAKESITTFNDIVGYNKLFIEDEEDDEAEIYKEIDDSDEYGEISEDESEKGIDEMDVSELDNEIYLDKK